MTFVSNSEDPVDAPPSVIALPGPTALLLNNANVGGSPVTVAPFSEELAEAAGLTVGGADPVEASASSVSTTDAENGPPTKLPSGYIASGV